MKSYLQLIDTETEGNRNDVTPLFADPGAFAQLVADLVYPFEDVEIDFVAGIDALGFILGTAAANRLGVGFIPIRKGGKLPVAVRRESCRDYTSEMKVLEIRSDAVPSWSRILLVDEWIETGGQMNAAIRLLEGCDATIVGIATIKMEINDATTEISNRYRVHEVWEEE